MIHYFKIEIVSHTDNAYETEWFLKEARIAIIVIGNLRASSSMKQ